jgi:hypothetical protein
MSKPENTNYLQPTKFLLTFPSIADTSFFCQKVNLPGINVPEMLRSVPNIDLYTPGTRIAYNTLDIEFSINENLSSWLVIYNWLRDNTTDQSFRYKNVDAVLTILSNMNNPKLRVKYSNVFPTTLGDIEFDTRLSAENHISATATFRFDYYDIEVI